jgi:hypothetical protein
VAGRAGAPTTRSKNVYPKNFISYNKQQTVKRESKKWVHIICRLDRVRSKKDEGKKLDRVRSEKPGRGKGREGKVVRTKEARKWDEGTSGQVKDNGNPHCRRVERTRSLS